MSLFIAKLAFGPTPELGQAKIGVLAASVIAALAGLSYLTWALPRPRRSGSAPPSGRPRPDAVGADENLKIDRAQRPGVADPVQDAHPVGGKRRSSAWRTRTKSRRSGEQLLDQEAWTAV